MDNLESLTNDELHVRLLEMGFPNLPVTTTTRKVLIKKLRKQLDGELSKTRRETINVMKHSSDEESDDKNKTNKTDNRRATVGPATVPKSMNPPKSSNPRRSGRITPNTKPERVASIATSSVPDIIEDTDEDDVIIIDDRRSKSKTPTGYGRRELASVSIKPIPLIQELVAEKEDIQPRISTRTTTEYESTYKRNSPTAISNEYESSTTFKRNSPPSRSTEYESIFKRNSPMPSRTTEYESNFMRNSPVRTAESATKRYTVGSSLSSSKYTPNTGFNTTDYGCSGTTSTTFSRPSITTSYNKYDTKSSYSTSSYGNTNYKSYQKPSAVTDEEEYDEEEDDQFDDNVENNEPIHAPYLSDFTRRLSSLKPEPLFQEKPTILSSPSYRSSIYQRTGINTTIKKQNSSFIEDFKAFYNRSPIIGTFILTSIILLILFIIVFIFF